MNGRSRKPLCPGSESNTLSPPSQTRTPSTASSPFKLPRTDVILRSVDGVDFHTWKGILIEASPVFADMFAIGASTNTESESEATNSLEGTLTSKAEPPVIDFLEHSSVLDPLLRTCYPPPHTANLPSLDALKPVLAAAHKYQMEGVLEVFKKDLLEYAHITPLRVYLLAPSFDMPDVAEVAAGLFIARPNADDYVSELEELSAGSYYRLLAYRKRCTQTLADMVASKLSWLPDKEPQYQFLTCSCAREGFTVALRDSSGVQRPVSVWFWQHYLRMGALLAERPCLSVLDDPKLRDQAVKKASECGNCRSRVCDDLDAFTASLKAEVKRRLAMQGPFPTL
ncbi:hypothetical protein K466DRAFT_666848 [Polyporus arcularius HHB13444]|uniref:BTB domain-containing protein n=1 Tax=Polyporus arcularius HHB13444 TaxID=1314778 RepID=A0A5C3P0S4_9APHY|nr:hypothetical protein K466DRAFT_666848 [Polyporus arcularius HHB13444]